MQRWSDAVLDPNGNAIRGASITVTRTSDGTTPTIYSINGSTEQTNPMTSGADGEYYFYAPNGRYLLTIAATGYGTDTKEVLLHDAADSRISGGFPYLIDRTSTADSDPGAGYIRFNNADPSLATTLYVDNSTADGPSLSTFFRQLSAPCILQLANDAGSWVLFSVSSITDGSGYRKFAGTMGVGVISFADQSHVRLHVLRDDSVCSFKDAGAVGDGSTDDASAVQAAITAYAGKVIDGGGLTYKINSPLTGVASGTVIQNATFDFSSMPVQVGIDKCFAVDGSLGTPVALTANTAAGSASIQVGSTSSFAADGLVWIGSTASWDDLQSVLYGQYARVKSVDSGTTLTLYAHVQMPFNTADSATIAPVTPKKNITFRNVKIIGAQANTQAGIYATYCEDLTVENCKFESIDYVSVALWRCYRSTVDRCRATFIRSSGNAYGYGVWSGSFGCSIVNSWGEDCRHTVTIGDNDGINMWTRVIGCHAINSKDAGFDSHAASMWTTFDSCHVEMSAARFLTSNHDGIIMQGLHGTVVNCKVYGFKGAGIAYQPLTKSGLATTIVIRGNTLVADADGYGSGAQGHGVYVNSDATYGGNIRSCIIEGNSIAGGTANSVGFNAINFAVFKDSGTAANLVIANNRCESASVTYACLIRTGGASASISGVKVLGNFFNASGTTVVYVLADGASSTMSDLLFSGNTLDGGSANSLRVRNTGGGTISKVRERGATYLNAVTKRSFETVADWLADLSEEAPQTITAATVTIAALSDEYIFNRAGTVTATLPAASSNPGRILRLKTIQAQAVDSASSNVAPIGDSAAGTAILPATDGAWAWLKSDGTNWVTMARGT